jgi:hypothetical protein
VQRLPKFRHLRLLMSGFNQIEVTEGCAKWRQLDLDGGLRARTEADDKHAVRGNLGQAEQILRARADAGDGYAAG